MTLPPWREEAISRHHDRESFDCGSEELNLFIRRYARQSHEAGGAKTFVLVDLSDGKSMLGFYSLSAASIAFEHAPKRATRRLARHEVPAFRLARLAVDRRYQGQGIGSRLLLLAGERCLRVSMEIGAVAILVDAKDERAAAWYMRLGAIPLDANPLQLLLMLDTLRAALE